MNKSELIDYMADAAEISKASAEKALKAFMDAVSKNLERWWSTFFGWFWFFFSA